MLTDESNESEHNHQPTTWCSSAEPVTNPTVPSPPLTPLAEDTVPGASQEELSNLQTQSTHITTINGLKIFNRDVANALQNNVRHVIQQLESGLCDHLYRRRVDLRLLALRPMLLGHTEEDVTLWIVVLCPSCAKSKVQRYLGKDVALNIYYGPPFRQYRFRTTVIGRPLKIMPSESLDEVFVEQEDPSLFEDWTPRIKVTQSDIDYYATVGGFVSIVNAEGRFSCSNARLSEPGGWHFPIVGCMAAMEASEKVSNMALPGSRCDSATSERRMERWSCPGGVPAIGRSASCNASGTGLRHASRSGRSLRQRDISDRCSLCSHP